MKGAPVKRILIYRREGTKGKSSGGGGEPKERATPDPTRFTTRIQLKIILSSGEGRRRNGELRSEDNLSLRRRQTQVSSKLVTLVLPKTKCPPTLEIGQNIQPQGSRATLSPAPLMLSHIVRSVPRIIARCRSTACSLSCTCCFTSRTNEHQSEAGAIGSELIILCPAATSLQ